MPRRRLPLIFGLTLVTVAAFGMFCTTILQTYLVMRATTSIDSVIAAVTTILVKTPPVHNDRLAVDGQPERCAGGTCLAASVNSLPLEADVVTELPADEIAPPSLKIPSVPPEPATDPVSPETTSVVTAVPTPLADPATPPQSAAPVLPETEVVVAVATPPLADTPAAPAEVATTAVLPEVADLPAEIVQVEVIAGGEFIESEPVTAPLPLPPEAADIKVEPEPMPRSRRKAKPVSRPNDEKVVAPVNTTMAGREQRLAQRLAELGLKEPPDLPPVQIGPPNRPLGERGVYLNPSTVASLVDDYLDAIVANDGNALIMDVKSGYVYFNSSAPLAKEIGLVKPLYNLPEIVQKAKARGLYVLARYVAVKDWALATWVPKTQMRHPRTGVSPGAVWVDPTHPTVLEYNRQVLREVALAGVDEINLDYIRYPTEYPVAALGLSATQRADRIEQFIKMAREVINTYAPQVRLGLSTFAILGWEYEVNLTRLGQDVARFAPLVDVISPMAYPSTFAVGSYYNPAVHPVSRNYYLVYRTLEGYKKFLGEAHSHKLRPWLQAYYMSVQGLKDQIQAVYDAGACGFTFWSANNIYGKSYQAIKNMPPPERCDMKI